MHKLQRSIPMPCLLVLFVLLGGATLTGCGEKTEMSKEDQKNFKGTGVMPPDAAAAIAKQKQAAQDKTGASGGAPAESVPGIPK